jgi:hypothetical protein
LRDGILALRFGVTLAVLVTGNTLGLSLAQAQSAARTDPLLNNGPPVWDTNHDGIFTCDEWKKFMEQLFVSGDKGRKGFLTPQEFEAIKKADPSLAEKPSVFILRFDRNGDCRVTPDELKAATTPQPTGGPQERPRDRFH